MCGYGRCCRPRFGICGGEPEKGVTGDANVAPGVEELGTHSGVEVDGRGVPVEDLPLEAGAAVFDGDGGDSLQEGLADAEAAEFGVDKEVFEVETGAAEPSRIVEEIESEAGRRAVVLGYKTEIEGIRTETVAKEVGFGGDDGVGFSLIGSKGADEVKDERNVIACGLPDSGCHVSILGCDADHTRLMVWPIP